MNTWIKDLEKEIRIVNSGTLVHISGFEVTKNVSSGTLNLAKLKLWL